MVDLETVLGREIETFSDQQVVWNNMLLDARGGFKRRMQPYAESIRERLNNELVDGCTIPSAEIRLVFVYVGSGDAQRYSSVKVCLDLADPVDSTGAAVNMSSAQKTLAPYMRTIGEEYGVNIRFVSLTPYVSFS